MKLRSSIAGVSTLAGAAIIAGWVAVLVVGWLAPEPMVGDEVTHYYMLTTQATCLSSPNFTARIPVAFDPSGYEVRHYPHAFGWHYLGAILYRLTGSLAVVQFYQSLFLLQLLVVAFVLCRRLGAAQTDAALLALAILVSQPMTLIFSVAFYQDVPAAAQCLTAFLFLLNTRWLVAAAFLALGVGMKETAILFLPVYLLMLAVTQWNRGVPRWLLSIAGTLLILAASCGLTASSLRHCGEPNYYPAEVLRVTINRIIARAPTLSPAPARSAAGRQTAEPRKVALYEDGVLANHPGDLRNAQNWFIYGGGVFWMFLLIGIAGILTGGRKAWAAMNLSGRRTTVWLGLAGVSCLVLTRLFLDAPEARFFYPGIVFCVIPLAVFAVRLPLFKWWIWLFVLAAVLQSGAVLYKTYSLRHVSAGIAGAIDFLRREPPTPNRVFMYPEGNYRLFPCFHDWYLLPHYEIREVWKGMNDRRLEILRRHGVGAVVVKKHLVGTLDPEMNRLGIYPDFFVQQIDADNRFRKVLDNQDVAIYRLPPLVGEHLAP